MFAKIYKYFSIEIQRICKKGCFENYNFFGNSTNSWKSTFYLKLCSYADIALDALADDQHGMSESTLNLGQKKGYEALQKLKKCDQIP